SVPVRPAGCALRRGYRRIHEVPGDRQEAVPCATRRDGLTRRLPARIAPRSWFFEWSISPHPARRKGSRDAFGLQIPAARRHFLVLGEQSMESRNALCHEPYPF